MAKKLKDIVSGQKSYLNSRNKDEQKFIDLHKVRQVVVHDAATGDEEDEDNLFQAKNMKKIDRTTPDNHGYNPGEDEDVYEHRIIRNRKV